MAIQTQTPLLPLSPTAVALRAAHENDFQTLETALNQVLALVDTAQSKISAGTFVLGGVGKSAWPTAAAGSSGQVFLTGSVLLKGMDGATVTHNKSDLNYLVKLNLIGVNAAAQGGQLSYVKSANTVVVYNTGRGSVYNQQLSAEIEISAL